jgi:hypothetical protein
MGDRFGLPGLPKLHVALLAQRAWSSDGIWLASFMHYDLGYFDLETLQPLDNRSARGCHPCLRYDLLPMSPGWTTAKLAERVSVNRH